MSRIINDPVLSDVWGDIEAEMARSIMVHHYYTHDTLRRAALVAEEAGEALKLALDVTRPPGMTSQTNPLAFRQLYAETLETAVMALRHLVTLREEGVRGSS